jgi:multidrug efflux system outer membrane protein
MLRNLCLVVLASAAIVPAIALAADGSPAADAPPAPPARPTIRAHEYTLVECLALADRNFPNLWAARARLANAHAQLDEAHWAPFFQWSANSLFGALPPLQGSVLFPSSYAGPTTIYSKNITGLTDLQPAFHFDIGGTFPLYTFGKIESAWEASGAFVRVNEWDLEKARQQTRMDVRRAYFGLLLARDGKYVFDESLQRLDKGIKGLSEKIDKGDPNLSEVDRLRLQAYRQEVYSQSLQVPKGEAYSLAALRFFTGVESSFDVPDEPLRRPDRPLASIAQYLEAARVLRPDVNMARAGVVARRAQVDLAHARLFPDLGLVLGAGFTSTPSATPQNNLFASDPFNGFGYTVGFGVHWSLDLLPQAARTQQAEAQLEETRAYQRLALSNAEFEVEKAYADALEAKGREESWDKAEHIAKQWLAIVQDHIDLGTWDERGLLEPLRVYGNARGQHLYALMDYNITMAALAQVSGWDAAAPGGS